MRATPALLLLLALLPAVCTARSVLRPASNVAAPDCAHCHAGIASLLSLAPEAKTVVLTMQREVCPGTASPQQCKRLSAAILPVLLSRAQASATPSRLCMASGSCSARQAAPLALQQQRALGDGPTCALCAFLVNRVKLYLNDTSVQQTIIDAADKACSSLPAEFAKSCTDFVDTYEPMLIQWLEAMDTTTMCMLMGACAVLGAPHPGPHFAPHFAPHHAAALERPVAAAAPVPTCLAGPLAALGAAFEAQEGTSNDACDICKMAVIEAHSVITNPSVQSNLVNYTKSLCSFAGGPFTQECDDFVDTYAPATFDFLEKLLTPDQLCAQLGVCRASLLQGWRAQAQALVTKLRLGAELLRGQQ